MFEVWLARHFPIGTEHLVVEPVVRPAEDERLGSTVAQGFDRVPEVSRAGRGDSSGLECPNSVRTGVALKDFHFKSESRVSSESTRNLIR